VAGKIGDEDWTRIKVADNIAFQAIEDYKNGVATRQAVLNALSVLENFLIQGAR
jgi:hypothetical protein